MLVRFFSSPGYCTAEIFEQKQRSVESRNGQNSKSRTTNKQEETTAPTTNTAKPTQPGQKPLDIAIYYGNIIPLECRNISETVGLFPTGSIDIYAGPAEKPA